MMPNFRNRKVLVTGGAGFIGSNTANALSESGASVSIVDNLSTGSKDNVPSNINLYEMNITDPSLSQVLSLEKPDLIYHFAFNVLVPNSVKNPLLDLDGIAGSLNLFQCAREADVRKVVFASSSFVYGNNPIIPTNEEHEIELVAPYAAAKYSVENYLQCFNKTYGLDYAIVRYATVYGPKQIKGAMADYIRKLKAGSQAEIWGDGSKTRDYVFISDVVKANLLVGQLSNITETPIFNIGTQQETSLNDVYQKIASLLGKESSPIYHPEREGELYKICLDYSKFHRLTGWKPEVSLDKGLQSCVEEFPDI